MLLRSSGEEHYKLSLPALKVESTMSLRLPYYVVKEWSLHSKLVRCCAAVVNYCI